MGTFKEKLNTVVEFLSITPKNLRICTILISIYQVLVAHVILFLVLLGLSHAEEMYSILKVDILDQNEREDYAINENNLRFEKAKELASMTLILLYIATAIATIYLFSCIGLFFGTLKNRAELMLPWLVLDLIGFLLTIALLIMSSGYIVVDIVGPFIYWSFCCSILLFDIVIWFVVHAFYLTLCKMKKLNESAMIPCPPPNSTIPKYYYSSEKIQLNGGDYKHLLTENVDQHNYII